LVIFLLVAGCSTEDNTRVFVDPATSEEAEFEYIALDNWILYSGQAGRAVILERDGKPVAFFNDLVTGRTLSIATEYGAPVVLTLVDEDFDGRYDLLRYDNGTVEVTDVGLDGEIETLRKRQ
jgi:hypothetical protein